MSTLMHIWMPTIRGYSGGDVFVERLATGLRSRGVTVTVQWFDRRYEFAPGLLAGRKAPPGATHIHANGLDGFAFRHHGLPLVVTEHHYVLDPGYRPYKSLAQDVYHRTVTGRASLRSMRSASALTTHSHFVAGVVRKACPAVRPVVVPLWVDLDEFSPGLVQAAREGPLRLLFVGNTSRRKGFDMAVALARRMGEAVEISCTGGLRGSAEASLPSNIRFVGRLSTEELVEAYRACDAALVPSRYEGFGYAALEGMACGKPVLGFACGSVEEIVEHGISGYLVPVDDIDGLHRHAVDLASDPSLRSVMGAAGRDRACNVFTVERGIEAYMDVYRSVASS
ncbi:glycosyltransferase family 4 protein [Luteibacter sp.]|uniref:glycosyltransferase family 4 protein n=1 Tax=Luteibacter sp. TaxID=1886636 RepID=UPI003F8026E5